MLKCFHFIGVFLLVSLYSSLYSQCSLVLGAGFGVRTQVDGGPISRYQEEGNTVFARLGFRYIMVRDEQSEMMKKTVIGVNLYGGLMSERFNDLDAEYVIHSGTGTPVVFTYDTQLYGLEIQGLRSIIQNTLNSNRSRPKNVNLYVGFGLRTGFKVTPRPLSLVGSTAISGFSIMADERARVDYRSRLSGSPFVSCQLEIELFKPAFFNRMLSLQLNGQLHPFTSDKRTTTIVTPDDTIISNSGINYSQLSIGLVSNL